MEMGDIFLASERSERDTLRCNAIEISVCLLASERSERAQSCSCSIEISDTYVYIARCQVVVKFYSDLYFGYSPP